MSFIPLHLHSHYSLLDGVIKIPDLIDAAKEHGMNAVAMTDNGNLYGAIEFYQAATKKGIKPIIGMETYIAPNGIHAEHEKTDKERPYQLVLLARDNAGYSNLLKLSTIANTEGKATVPRVDMEVLTKHADGLIALTGSLDGAVPRALLKDDKAAAEKLLLEYIEMYGVENVYAEVQVRPTVPNWDIVNEGLKALSAKLGIQLIATNDTRYLSTDDAEAQDVVACIRTKHLLTDTERPSRRNEDYSFKSEAEMLELFADMPEAVHNTQTLADRIDVTIELDKIQLPHYELPEGVTPEQELRRICVEGMEKKYDEITDEIRERLDYELDIINTTGYASYFLIVQDFINWSKDQGIAVGPGRGSAAGAIVAYLTGITDIDPIHYELLFERFLNPERVSMPDIDTDFADVRRDDVLRYVEEKYGKDRVAQIITFGTIGARAGIRDVGRVMGLSYGYCDRIAKLIPMFTSLKDAVETVPELSEMLNQDADADRLVQVAMKLEGVARHTSIHACAVVITKDPLVECVPLQTDDENTTIITQFSMNPIEKLGLLKMDFLGLKNLSIIEDALNIIEATTGDTIDIEHIPLDDKKTFQLLKKANTIGVFQLESSGMRRYLKTLKPTEMEDIIAMVSLYRPGPMEFIPDYVAGKHGRREPTYLDEGLRPILEKTYGIAVYQEQIMQIARSLAGFSYGEADVLRKAVGKKIKELLDEQETKIIDGMVQNGLSRSVAKQIWEFILPFARYGFNRSHAACYAMIAYRTAYLKAHYPAQFMAALMNADRDNTERIAIEVVHAQELGVEVLPPHINESYPLFSVVKDSLGTTTPQVRFGLRAIKNVGDHIVDVIRAERKEKGPYTKIEHFLTRVQDKDLNKKSVESLIKTGALDDLGDRSQLLFNLERLLGYAKRAQQDAASGQGNLFGGLSEEDQLSLTLEETPPIDRKVLLNFEKELLGLYVTGNPLDEYKDLLEEASTPFCTLRDHNKQVLTLLGMVTYIKRITTRSGDQMMFIGFADHTAEIELLLFPRVLEETGILWAEDETFRVTGKVDTKDGSPKVLVETVERIDLNDERVRLQKNKAQTIVQEANVATEAVFQVPNRMNKRVFAAMKDYIEKNEGPVRVYLEADGKRIDTKKGITPESVETLRELLENSTV